MSTSTTSYEIRFQSQILGDVVIQRGEDGRGLVQIQPRFSVTELARWLRDSIGRPKVKVLVEHDDDQKRDEWPWR